MKIKNKTKYYALVSLFENLNKLFKYRIWQRGRDSNPRYVIHVYTLSRRATSTTHPPLCGNQIVLFFQVFGKNACLKNKQPNQILVRLFLIWCPGEDSNFHTREDTST